MTKADDIKTDPQATTPSNESQAESPATPKTPVAKSAPEPAASDEETTSREAAAAKARDAYRSAKAAASKTSAYVVDHLDPKRHDGLFIVRYLERLVERIRTSMAAAPADRCLDRLVHYGNLAAIIAMALALVYGVLGAVRHAMFSPIPKAVAFVLILAAFQYAANKFLAASRALMGSTPSRMASAAFLNTVALLHTVMSVLFLVGGLLLALQQRDLGILIVAVFLAFVAYGVAFISLYPDRINVTVDDGAGAGEEAIGILSYGIKLLVCLLPVVYGLGMIAGMLSMLGACFARLGQTGITTLGQQGAGLLLVAGAAPFVAYLVFAFYQLGLDVLRAILVLPAKLDGRSSDTR